MKSAGSYVIVGDAGFASSTMITTPNQWAGTLQNLNAVSGSTDATLGYVWAVGNRGVILRGAPLP
jgi:hypothetical protein